tara:strand:+ start:1341 stop:1592 length:252 start_codon:yes stop_codon:yes gene_type:complete
MMTYDDLSFALSVAFSKKVAKRAAIVAIIVGTILAFINHGDQIMSGDLTINRWIKMIATSCVPFTVSIITAAMTALEARKFAD